jgi:hypothetical protein
MCNSSHSSASVITIGTDPISVSLLGVTILVCRNYDCVEYGAFGRALFRPTPENPRIDVLFDSEGDPA